MKIEETTLSKETRKTLILITTRQSVTDPTGPVRESTQILSTSKASIKAVETDKAVFNLIIQLVAKSITGNNNEK